jgi:hypothetical protein
MRISAENARGKRLLPKRGKRKENARAVWMLR